MIIISRTGKPPLRFDGRKLAEISGQTWGQPKRPRRQWHTITVYECSTGGYVVVVSYCTIQPGEIPHTHAEHVEYGDQIPAALIDYDPLDHVRGFPPGEQFARKQQRLLCDVQRVYDWIVGDLLASPDLVELVAEDVDA